MVKTTNASDKFIVRLPDGMRDELKAAAVANGRTMNAEIVARIANSAPERTLRDEFAMAALPGLLVRSSPQSLLDVSKEYNINPSKALAIMAYEHADAMLRARGGDRD